MLAGLLPRLATMLVQPSVLAAGVATGVAVGTVGVATGAIPVADPAPRQISLFECPDSARVVTHLQPNQNVLVTARSADGAWLQIYVGEVTVERGWAKASALQLRAAPESLPIEDCVPQATPEPTPGALSAPPSVFGSSSPGTTANATVLPTGVLPSGSAPPASTSTAPTAPTATPSKTPTPTPTPFVGPTVSNLEVNYADYDPVSGHYWVYRPGLVCEPNYVTFQVTAIDPTASDGQVASATFSYALFGQDYVDVAMYVEDDVAHIWQADLNIDSGWPYGRILFKAYATDSQGHDSVVIYPTSQWYLELHTCP